MGKEKHILTTDHIKFEWLDGDSHFNLYCDGSKQSHLYYTFGFGKKDITKKDFEQSVHNYLQTYGKTCLE